jgi:hypothetical protein
VGLPQKINLIFGKKRTVCPSGLYFAYVKGYVCPLISGYVKMDHLPVENPGGQPMGERRKVQKQTQKKVACGHTLKIDPAVNSKERSSLLFTALLSFYPLAKANPFHTDHTSFVRANDVHGFPIR